MPPVVINGAMPISWTVKKFRHGSNRPNPNWADRVYLLINNNQLFNLGTFPRPGGLAIDGEYPQNQVVNIPLFLQGDVIIFVETDFYNAGSKLISAREQSGLCTNSSF
ncbi:MAG: hypothetical protein IPM21_12050 [Acidobacteria bacterium]|nr:hypothetical protein [Acidobacteriota bacterium]